MKDIKYWKENAIEDYIITPISVLRYITELEKKNEAEQLTLTDVGCSFLDELIEKHKANKKLALINCEKMKDSKDFPWYDATFNNELLFVFELKDLKIRLGL